MIIAHNSQPQKRICTPPTGGKNQLSGNSTSSKSASDMSFSFSITPSDNSRNAVSSGQKIALHKPQFLHQPQPSAGIVEHHQHQFFAIKVHEHPSLSGTQRGCTPGHRIFLLRQPAKPVFPAWYGGCLHQVLQLLRLCP